MVPRDEMFSMRLTGGRMTSQPPGPLDSCAHMFRFSALILLAAVGIACKSDRPSAAATTVRGMELGAPIARPSFTLTATDGKPYAFHERTAGKLTFLFFGYTNCPDVCPLHAANIAAVLNKLPWADRQKVDFVFITTDPERDSLPALRKWLDHFDSTFVGLRGTFDEVAAIQKGLNLPSIPPGPKQPDGSYEVPHSAMLLAFEPDDKAHVFYLGGTRQEDWAADIPRLLTRYAK